jgi:NADPH:quinone reductase-like Zn-dependent oxidoreductase
VKARAVPALLALASEWWPTTGQPPPPRREPLLTAADQILLARGAAAKNFTTTYGNAILGSGVHVPVARTYPLDQVRDAFADLEQRHTLGKIVLLP